MKIRIDAFIIILSAVFIFALSIARNETLNLGPYSQLIVVVVYFTLLSYYDQFRKPHLERNYILVFSLAAIYIGAVIGYVVSNDWGGIIKGGGLAFLITLGAIIIMRKRFYAWIDRVIGDKSQS